MIDDDVKPSLDERDAGSDSKTRRGRKRKDADDEDAKAEKRRNLEAQRLFQQRRKEHVSKLEKEVTELKALLAGRPLPDSPSSEDIASLKQQVLTLEAENSMMRQNAVLLELKPSKTNTRKPECQECSVQKMKALLCMGQIKALEGKVTDLQVECQNLRTIIGGIHPQRPPHHQIIVQHQQSHEQSERQLLDSHQQPDQRLLDALYFNSIPQKQQFGRDLPASHENDISFLEDFVSRTRKSPTPTGSAQILSATELFGPPEVEFAKISLKALPSLKNSKYVDQLFDLFVKQSESTDREVIKKYGLKCMILRGKILDECDIVDRQRVIELIVIFLERNKNHVLFRNSMFDESAEDIKKAWPSPEPMPEVPAQAKRFRDSLLAVPSLTNAKDLINEFCTLVWSNNVKGQGKDKLVKIFAIRKRLEATCTDVEDRTKYSLIMEVFREGNRKRFDELFEEVESEFQ